MKLDEFIKDRAKFSDFSEYIQHVGEQFQKNLEKNHKITRKLTGSYYTPDYITHYIIEHTLIPFLFRKLKIHTKTRNINTEEELKTLFHKSVYGKDIGKNEDFSSEMYLEIYLNLKTVKILDNACGCGMFLLNVYDIMMKIFLFLNKILSDTEKFKNEKVNILDSRSIYTYFGRILLENIIHGVDIQEEAVKYTCQLLFLRFLEDIKKEKKGNKSPKITDITFNIKQGNTLIGKIQNNDTIPDKLKSVKNKFNWQNTFSDVFSNTDNPGFDIIIGNPPYLNNKSIPKEEKPNYKLMGYFTAYKLYDLSVLFIERSIDLLNEGGILSYITTNKFISTDYGIRTRQFLLEKTSILEFVDISHLSVFETIATYPIIIVCQKRLEQQSRERDDRKIAIISANSFTSLENFKDLMDFENNIHDIQYIDESVIQNTPNKIIDISGNAHICEYIRQQNITFLRDLNPKWVYRPMGFTNWKEQLKYVHPDSHEKKSPLQNTQTSHTPHTSQKFLRFIGCTHINPYCIDWKKPIHINRQKIERGILISNEDVDPLWETYQKEQIFIKEVSKKIDVAYNRGAWAHLTGIYGLYVELGKNRLNLKYLLTLLNSKLINFYYKSIFGSSHMAGGYLNFHASYLERIPIYNLENEYQEILSKLADYLIFLSESWINQIFISDLLDKKEFEEISHFIKELVDIIIVEIYMTERVEVKSKQFFLIESIKKTYQPIEVKKWADFMDNVIYLSINKDINKKELKEFKTIKEIYSKNINSIKNFIIDVKSNKEIQDIYKNLKNNDWISKIL